MQQSDHGPKIDLDGEGLSIGIVRARFNHEITSAMADACLSELKRLGVAADNVRVVDVPGALEVPPARRSAAACARLRGAFGSSARTAS